MKPRTPPTHPPRRLAVLAFLVVVLLVGPGCVSWEPVVLPTLRWFAALFS